VESRRALIEETVTTLAAVERPSASPGERQAAEWIARRLGELGAEARIEQERAHGGYWWPLALPNVLAALAGLNLRRRPRSRIRRAIAAALGALGAAAVWDDVGGGRLWLRRALLPSRDTWNVVAETGDPAGERAVVFVAHHDAAHSGLIFHPALPSWTRKRFPRLVERSDRHLPVLYGVFLGPLLVALGAVLRRRRPLTAGIVFGLGGAAVMADIGLRPVVPGANDNLSSVAVLLALADELREHPVPGVRVLLVSTGSEESFMEGMQGFMRRHSPVLDRDRTEVVCLECVGSPNLVVVEGEGMLRMRDYPHAARESLAEAAAEAGVPVRRGLRTIAATDGLIALRAGYRTATLGGIDWTMFPSDYHWPSDIPDNLSWGSIEGAIAICAAFIRRPAAESPARQPWPERLAPREAA
jgi:acetylornithine deacetylase/succinyl-diaminopimelate desuccinylase-like protein